MPLISRYDPVLALGLLTRIPAPVDPETAAERGAQAAWAWPLVGAALGAAAGAAGWGAVSVGLPASVAAGLALAVLILATGALHEDGLADCADGFWGGHDPERRLEIMKDSRIGAYGVIALILMIGLRWAALAELIGAAYVLPALMFAEALSRAAMAVTMHVLPFARQSGLAAHVGQPGFATAMLGVGIAASLGFVTVGLGATLIVCLVVAGGVAGMATLSRYKIGGQTGDVLGATQQLSATLALFALLVLL